MNQTTKVTAALVVGLAALGALAIYGNSGSGSPSVDTAEAERAERHRESMDKWYAENPDSDMARLHRGEGISPAKIDRYLDSRTGAALERTVKRVISMSGYKCERIRRVERIAAEELARLGAEDGRWVDCNEDGVYGVLESSDGFRAVKR